MAERKHIGLEFIGTGFYSLEFMPRDYWPYEVSADERARAVESGLYREKEYPSNRPDEPAPKVQRSTEEVE